LVTAGDKLAKNKDYAGALQKYNQAYQIFPSEEIKVRRDNARRASSE
jgi:hypothetical protein